MGVSGCESPSRGISYEVWEPNLPKRRETFLLEVTVFSHTVLV